MPKTWFGVLEDKIANSKLAAINTGAADPAGAALGVGAEKKAPVVDSLSRSLIRYDAKAATAMMAKPVVQYIAPPARSITHATPSKALLSPRADQFSGLPRQAESPRRPRTGTIVL